ncbi:MAG: hypothetical protein MJY79_00895 [Bacteroidaceae bacterium]|nr:hypothetical protein [Bacteroidaceae bacterium]
MKTFLSAVLLFLVCSCAEKGMFPDVGDSTRDWRDVLCSVVADNKTVFESEGLSMRSFHEVESDWKTGNMCANPQMVDSIISEYEAHNSQCKVVAIEWDKNKQTFFTIALFDEVSGELLYDDILFNLLLSNSSDRDNMVAFLTSAEYEPTQASGGNQVTYSYAGRVVAKSSVSWAAYGYWDYVDIPRYTNVVERQYFYCHERLVGTTSGWIDQDYCNANNLDVTVHGRFIKFTDDYSGGRSFSYRYELAAGIGTDVPFALLGDNFDNTIQGFNVKVYTSTESPQRPSEFISN